MELSEKLKPDNHDEIEWNVDKNSDGMFVDMPEKEDVSDNHTKPVFVLCDIGAYKKVYHIAYYCYTRKQWRNDMSCDYNINVYTWSYYPLVPEGVF